MTRLTCCMSSAMGASRLAALGAGVAVDDMVAISGNAADYKANRAISAARGGRARLFWPFGLCWEHRNGPERALSRREARTSGTRRATGYRRTLTGQLTLCI